jgi:hypothetical protein
MHFVLVAYNFTTAKQLKWKHFLSSFPGATSVVVENAEGSPTDAESVLKGSNRHYEFSGYLEGMSASCQAEKDPYWVVLNDTLFSHHWAMGWRYIISQVSHFKDGLYGDYRQEPISWEGRPLTIYASWIFMLKGSQFRSEFQTLLREVLTSFDTPLHFPGYKAYQRGYLRATLFSGYTSVVNLYASSKALEIKTKCIHAEHRLGRTLDNLGWVQRLPGRGYSLVHFVDRWLSFKRRASRLLKG